uniref:hypothetical protein n=1 Tax=Flavobacterium sp. TaxID=239 RepID=UPI00404A2670
MSVLYSIIYLFSFYFEIGFPYFQYAFPIIAITFLIYEFYYGEKRTLVKAHKKMILDEYSHLFNKTNVLTFKNTFLTKNNEITSLKVDYEKIEIIEELNEYFFFKLKSGDRIILPKSYILDLPTFYHFLNKITQHYELNLVDETKWKW